MPIVPTSHDDSYQGVPMSIKDDISELQERIDALDDLIARQVERNERLERRVRELRRELQAQIDALEERIATLEAGDDV